MEIRKHEKKFQNFQPERTTRNLVQTYRHVPL